MPLCNIAVCTEQVKHPSRVGYAGAYPCEPGQESGYCDKHAPKLMTPEERARAEATIRTLVDALAGQFKKETP